MDFLKKIYLFTVLVFILNLSTKAQIISFTPPPEDDQPSVQDIIKRIEDTLNIRQGKVKMEDTRLAEDKLKQIAPTPNTIGVDKNAPDKLLNEAQKATETVEKLTETATLELRENLDTVDIFGFDFFRRKEVD